MTLVKYLISPVKNNIIEVNLVVSIRALRGKKPLSHNFDRIITIKILLRLLGHMKLFLSDMMKYSI